MAEDSPRFCQLDYIPAQKEINSYDEIASVYDEVMGEDFCRMVSAPLLSVIRQSFRKVPVLKCLDLACGTGSLIYQFSEALGAECYGIDLSKEQIGIAKQKQHKREVRFEVGDVLKVKFPGDCNLVTMTLDALNHIGSPDDWSVLFAKVYRALKPGGIFIFDVNSRRRLLHDWSYPEVIIKRQLTYIQCALSPVETGQLVRRRILMQAFAERDSTIKRYSALIEQIALSKERIKQMLNSAGFFKVREILRSKELQRQHVFLKNRFFIASYK